MDKFRLYLYFWTASFFFLLAFIVFYTFGYKIDPKTGETVQNGGIVLKTAIKDITVYKDGKIEKESDFISDLITDFIKIENLKPDSYYIEVGKEGYQNWGKNIEVEAGKVEKYENIVILKKEYEAEILNEELEIENQKEKWISNKQNQIAYITEEEGSLYLLDLENETNILLLTPENISLMGEITEVKWLNSKDSVMVKTLQEKKEYLFLINISNQKIYKLNDRIIDALNEGKNIKLYNDFIFFQEDNSILTFDYKDKKLGIFLEGISNFDVNQNSIYFFNEDEDLELKKMEISSNYEIKFTKMPLEFDINKNFEVQEMNNRLLIISENSIYLIDKDGKTEKIMSNIKNAYFSQGGKMIIANNDREIWAYYTEDRKYQPYKEKGEKELITRFSGELKNVYVYIDEEHLIYKREEEIKFVELDGRDNRNFQTIYSADAENIFYNRNTNAVYFWEDNEVKRITLGE